ncbi:MAG: trigger factor [Deltaproteobacteria bacterium]|nr:trigger factor [Deltaproteobacteria bacterium]
MKVSIEDLSSVKKKIVVEIPSEDVKRAVDDEYKYLQKNANIHGFRKGKVPIEVIKRHYGEHIRTEVTSKLIDDSYPNIVIENKIQVAARPEIENIGEIKDGASLTYTAIVEVRPDVKIEGYKDIKIKKEDVPVSDKEIDDTINILRERHAVFKDIEGHNEAKDGHLVSVDFSGTIDDKPIDGADAKDYSFVIGSATLLKDLEDAVVGMKKSDARDVDVKFPEEYKNKEIAGKTGRFKVLLKDIKEKILPDLNDEFAKDADCENMEQLKERMKIDLARYKEKTEEERIRKEVMKELIDKNKFEIPRSLVEHYYRYLIAQAAERLKKGIISKEDMGLSVNEFNEKYTKLSEDLVRQDIIVDSIAKDEGLDVSGDEVDARIKELADSAKEPIQAFKAKIEEEGGLNYIKESLLENKVFDLILSGAK